MLDRLDWRRFISEILAGRPGGPRGINNKQID